MTELRQRMIDAMVQRGLAQRTQDSYVDAIYRMAKFYRRDPAGYSASEVQTYLLHLVKERHLSYSTVNQAACAARLLFETVLGHGRELFPIPMAKVPAKQPELLSRAEIVQLFGACSHPVHRVLLQTVYAGGLRVSEACALRITDIDSAADRMCLRIASGKGGKGRYSILSPTLLAALRLYVRSARPRSWLFCNASGVQPVSIESAQRAYHGACQRTRIMKRGGIHSQIASDPQGNAPAWRERQRALYCHDWVVYAKAPLGGPAQALEYLSRYTHRTAIGNERIRAITHDEVTLSVRADDKGGKRQIRLQGAEFVRRVLLHVLPTGIKRIRHYGVLAPACKGKKLDAARQDLQMPAPNTQAIESAHAFMKRIARIDALQCPCCKSGTLHCVQSVAAPKWLPAPGASVPHSRGPP